jgi:hypothetical protein
VTEDAKMVELLSVANKHANEDAPKSKTKQIAATEFEILRLQLFLKHSKDAADEGLVKSAPTVTIDKMNGKHSIPFRSFSVSVV